MLIFRIAANAARHLYRGLTVQPSAGCDHLRKPLVTWVGPARTRREDESLRRAGMMQAQ
jgi:hypothetical protein